MKHFWSMLCSLFLVEIHSFFCLLAGKLGKMKSSLREAEDDFVKVLSGVYLLCAIGIWKLVLIFSELDCHSLISTILCMIFGLIISNTFALLLLLVRYSELNWHMSRLAQALQFRHLSYLQLEKPCLNQCSWGN